MVGILTGKNEYAELMSEKTDISVKLSELRAELATLKLPKNFVKLRREKCIELYGKEKVDRREELVEELLKLEEQGNIINQKLKKFRHEKGDILHDVLKDLFTSEQWILVTKEVDRRLKGEPPIKISFSPTELKNKAERSEDHKKIAIELIKILIDARQKLNNVIQEGCHKHGNAEFLKLVSPINQSLPPIGELEKKRRINHI